MFFPGAYHKAFLYSPANSFLTGKLVSHRQTRFSPASLLGSCFRNHFCNSQRNCLEPFWELFWDMIGPRRGLGGPRGPSRASNTPWTYSCKKPSQTFSISRLPKSIRKPNRLGNPGSFLRGTETKTNTNWNFLGASPRHSLCIYGLV